MFQFYGVFIDNFFSGDNESNVGMFKPLFEFKVSGVLAITVCNTSSCSEFLFRTLLNFYIYAR